MNKIRATFVPTDNVGRQLQFIDYWTGAAPDEIEEEADEICNSLFGSPCYTVKYLINQDHTPRS